MTIINYAFWDINNIVLICEAVNNIIVSFRFLFNSNVANVAVNHGISLFFSKICIICFIK